MTRAPGSKPRHIEVINFYMRIGSDNEITIAKPLGFKDVLIPGLLFLIISILSYGFFVAKMGYFWDDWGTVYTQYFYGGKGFWQYVTERPFDNYYYEFISKIMGIKPLYWHVYIIFTRWIAGCLFYVFLRKVSSAHFSFALSASLLFIIYPGFGGNSIAWNYSLYYLIMSCVMLSLIFMLEYITSSKKSLLILALVFEAVHLLLNEYFVGVEFSRVFIIYLILYSIQNQGPKILDSTLFKKAFRYSRPYYGVFILYLLYRTFFLHQTSLPETNQKLILHKFLADPVHNVIQRFQNFISDFFNATIFLWGHFFSGDFFSIGAKIVFAISFLVILLFYLKHFKQKHQDNMKLSDSNLKNLSLLFIAVGLILIVLGNIPIIVIGKSIVLSSYGIGDRYTLPEIFGSCIFLTGVLHYFISDQKVLLFTLSILTAAGCAYQFSVSRIFSEENKNLSNFYREVTWRMPSVEKGTYFMLSTSPNVPSTSAGYSYSFGINGIYGKGDKMSSQNYWLTDFNDKKDTNPTSIQKNIPVAFKLRSYGFKGNTSKSITLFYPETGCLRVADSTNILWLGEDANASLAGTFTDTKLIRDTSRSENGFLDEIYGPENKNCWCYYFEKMELARQNNEWGKAVNIINQGIAKKLKPDNDVEWVSVLEVAIRSNKFDLANEIVNTDLVSNLSRGYACKLLSMSKIADQEVLNRLINKINKGVKSK